jgi:hypothetical protein
MIAFKEWLKRRGGTKLTATGLNSGGRAQNGMHHLKPVLPHSPLKNAGIRH